MKTTLVTLEVAVGSVGAKHGGVRAGSLNGQTQVVGGGLQAAVGIGQVRVIGYKKHTHARLPGLKKEPSAGMSPAEDQD